MRFSKIIGERVGPSYFLDDAKATETGASS